MAVLCRPGLRRYSAAGAQGQDRGAAQRHQLQQGSQRLRSEGGPGGGTDSHGGVRHRLREAEQDRQQRLRLPQRLYRTVPRLHWDLYGHLHRDMHQCLYRVRVRLRKYLLRDLYQCLLRVRVRLRKYLHRDLLEYLLRLRGGLRVRLHQYLHGRVQ